MQEGQCDDRSGIWTWGMRMCMWSTLDIGKALIASCSMALSERGVLHPAVSGFEKLAVG